ncbi:TetR family transcriptional regulator [Alteromonas gracilis]
MSRGRRRGSPDTRAQVLEAARELFAAQGFAGTSIRAIAARAGVDPSLVHHYFGPKDDLFLAALALPVDPREVLAPALAGGADGAGERLLRTFVSVWDDPDHQDALIAVARLALDPQAGERLLRDGFLPVVLQPVGAALGLDRPELRMPLVMSQLVGLIVTRYLLRVEPVASMSTEALVAAYAPVLQRFLTGDLDGPSAPR